MHRFAFIGSDKKVSESDETFIHFTGCYTDQSADEGRKLDPCNESRAYDLEFPCSWGLAFRLESKYEKPLMNNIVLKR